MFEFRSKEQMNVGQGTWDSVQLKTVAHSACREGLNFQSQTIVVRWLWWSFGAYGLQKGEFVPLTVLPGSAEGEETYYICLAKD